MASKNSQIAIERGKCKIPPGYKIQDFLSSKSHFIVKRLGKK